MRKGTKRTWKGHTRRILTGVLSLVLVSTMMPASALATVEDAAGGETAIEQQAPEPDNGDGFEDESAETTVHEEGPADDMSAQEEKQPAVWSIVLDANGGKSEDDVEGIPDIVEDQDVAELPRSPYQREGYRFAGWHTKKSPEGKDVANPNPDDPEEAGRYIPDATSLYNLSYSYVVLDDGTIKIAGQDAVERGKDADGRKVRTCDLRDQLEKDTLTLYAQWEEIEAQADGSPTAAEKNEEEKKEEAAERAAKPEKSEEGSKTEQEAEEAQLPAAAAEDMAVPTTTDPNGQAVYENTFDGDETASEDAAARENVFSKVAKAIKRAFSNGGDETTQNDLLIPIEETQYTDREGNTRIENIHVKWIMGGDEEHLKLAPVDDSDMEVRIQLDYSVSGDNKYGYAPGEIEIKIPETIFTNRQGKAYGVMSLPLPEEPQTGANFNYRHITENGLGYYIITNTRKLEPTHRAMFEFTISELRPHEIQDGATTQSYSQDKIGAEGNSDWDGSRFGNFWGIITCTTQTGKSIQLASNEIDAQVDTHEYITDTRKSGTVYEEWQNDWPKELRPENPDDYIYVRWYTYCYNRGNQEFTLTLTDKAGESGNGWDDSEYGEIVLGTESDTSKGKSDGTTYEKEVFGPGYRNGSTSYSFLQYVYTAYPKEKLPAIPIVRDSSTVGGVSKPYYLHNTATWTLTPADGMDKPTTVESSAVVTYSPVEYSYPTGHFMVHKYSGHSTYKKDKVYGYALNQIQQGKDVDMDFTLETIGYGMPWTYFDPDHPEMGTGDNWEYAGDGTPQAKPEFYNKIPYTLETYDEHTYFDFLEGEGDDLTSDDFKVVSVEFQTPNMYKYGKNHDGSWGYQYNYSISARPDIELYAMLDGSGEWIKYGTVSYRSGQQVIKPENGATKSGNYLFFPEDVSVTDFKQVVSTRESGIVYYTYPVIRLYSNDKTKAIADKYFAQTDSPSTKFRNDDSLDVYDNHGSVIDANGSLTKDATEDGAVDMDKFVFAEDETNKIVHLEDATRSTLQGVSLGVVATKHASYDRIKDNDPVKQTVTIHYSADVTEQSNVPDADDYRRAIEDGVLHEEKSGVWYDLLPREVVPDLSTIRLRGADAIKRAYTIENYKGSGRTLLVVEADLTPVVIPKMSDNKVNLGYRDILEISFDATYTWEAISDLSGALNNVIAFESLGDFAGEDDVLGTIRGEQGEPDDPTAGMNRLSKYAVTGNDIPLMTGLDPDGGQKARFVYANARNQVSANQAALTSYSKLVSIDGSGFYSNGQENEATAWEGGGYTYRLRVASEDGKSTKKIVLYDSLENYTPISEDIDFEDAQWKGTFDYVDVTQLEKKGIAPRVYYSTQNLDVYEDAGARDLSNKEIWSDTPPANKAEVKAIAIDASLGTNGDAYELPAGEAMSAFVHMTAPTGKAADDAYGAGKEYQSILQANGGDAAKTVEDPRANAHAYNDTVLVCQVTTLADNVSEDNVIRETYTKVGLVAYKIGVHKVWDDKDNNDGKRPGSVTVRLTNHGEPAKTYDTDGNLVEVAPLVLNARNDWSGTFEDILAQDPETGEKINYAIVEENVPGYKLSVSKDSATGNSYTLTNRHVLETVGVKASKTWDDEGNALNTRPETIKLDLLADGEVVDTADVTVDGSGRWEHPFKNLQKYKRVNGKSSEIVYSVEEQYVPGYATTYSEGDQGVTIIENRWYPYGNLVVDKTIVNATPAAAEKEFTFHLMLENAQGEPLEGRYDYKTSDGREGKIGAGESFTLRGGEKLTIIDIPSESRYSVEEDAAPGFSTDVTDTSDGSIKAGRNNLLSFVNTYSSAGSAQLQASKQLTGRLLERYQFRFTLWDDAGKVVRQASVLPNGENDVNGDGDTVSGGTVTFGQIPFTEADDGKNFSYTITEDDISALGDAYTGDRSVHKVTVHVADNGDGTMTVTPIYEDGDLPMFENSYKAEGEYQFLAWKELEGRTLKAGEFQFRLLDSDNNVLQTKENAADGSVTFDPIKFTQKDAGKDRIFLVNEVVGKDETVNYTSSVKGYRLSVIDNGDGTLSFKQTYLDTGTGFETCDTCGGAEEITCEDCGGSGSTTFTKMRAYRRYTSANYSTWQRQVERANIAVNDEEICHECHGKGYVANPPTRENEVCTICRGTGLDNAAELAKDWQKYSISTIGSVKQNYSSFDKGYLDYALAIKSNADGFYSNNSYAVRANPYSYLYLLASHDCEKCGGDGRYLCEDCNGAGVTPNDNPAFVEYAETEDLPIFTNTLQPGRLSITKEVQDEDPDNPYQDFKFKVVLLGDQAGDGSYDYTLTDASGSQIGTPRKAEAEKRELAADATQTSKRAPRAASSPRSAVSAAQDERSEDWEQVAAQAVAEASAAVERYQDEAETKQVEAAPTEVPATAPALSKLRRALAKVSSANATIQQSGTMSSCTWELYSDGKLVIRPTNGSEGTLSYSGNWPWLSYASQITTVAFEGTVHLSGYAGSMFYSCSNVVSIDMSGTDVRGVGGTQCMFQNCTSLVEIKGIESWDTSSFSGTQSMFQNCASLKNVDLKSWNLGNVTGAQSMFYNCASLESVDASSWGLGKCTGLESMFQNCKSLKNADLSSLDTSRVTSLSSMFSGCTSLESIDLSRWETSNITSASSMFYNCSSLESIDLAGLDLSKLSSAQGMFSGCSKLKSFDFSTNNWAALKYVDGMFSGCSELVDINLRSAPWDRLSSANGIFSGCSSLESVDLSGVHFNTDGVYLSTAFSGCSALESVNLSHATFGSGSSMGGMFSGLPALKRVDMSYLVFGDNTNGPIFSGCKSVETVDMSHMQWGNNVNMCGMFSESNLKTIDMSYLKAGNNVSIYGLSNSCKNLEKFDMSNLDAGDGFSISGFSSGCPNLADLNMTNVHVGNNGYLQGIFSGSSALKSLALEGFVAGNDLGMQSAFSNCTSLEDVSMAGAELGDNAGLQSLFQECTGLKTANLTNIVAGNNTSLYSMFYKCNALEMVDLSNGTYGSHLGMSSVLSGLPALTSVSMRDVTIGENAYVQGLVAGDGALRRLNMSGTTFAGSAQAQSFASGCTSLTFADLSNVDWGNQAQVNNMFAGDSALLAVKFDGMKASNLDASYILAGCSSLESIDFSDTAPITIQGFGSAFSGCTSMETADLSTLNTRNASMGDAFAGTESLNTVVLGSGFSFNGSGSSTSQLLDSPEPDYSGEWMRTDDPELSFLPSDLRGKFQTDPATYAGTWVWAPVDAYTVVFDANGGEGAMDPQRMGSDKIESLSTGAFYRLGYVFDGWNTSSDGSGEAYADAAEVTGLADSGAQVVLYAQWKQLETTVDVSGGEFELTLHAGETATFDNMPAGVAYQVYEETPKGWVLVSQTNASGTIEPLKTSNAVFTNNFQPKSTAVQLYATKLLDGQLPAAGAFDFVLTGVDGAPMPVAGQSSVTASNDAEGFVSFPAITFTEDTFANADVDDNGTRTVELTYQIAETDTGDEAVRFDTHVEVVKVVVFEDLKGKMTATVEYDEDGPAFTNTSRPGSLAITKQADGGEDVEFQFDVRFKNSNGQPLDASNMSYYVTDGKDAGTGALDAVASVLKAPFALFAPEKAYAETTGTAYAMQTLDKKQIIFFRSNTEYNYVDPTVHKDPDTGRTINDFDDYHFEHKVTIDGVQYTGLLYKKGIETYEGDDYTPRDHWNPNALERVWVAKDTIIRPKSMYRWFWTNWGDTEFDMRGFDTSQCVSMKQTFGSANNNIKLIGIENWDVSNVKDMSYMFYDCRKLSDVDVSRWDVSNVENMHDMFEDCHELKSIDVSNWNTSKCKDMSGMFMWCTGLGSIDMSSWDISSAETMSYMFWDCYKLSDVKLGEGWSHAPNLKTTNSMFNENTSLKSIDLSLFDVSAVEDMAYMFAYDSALEEIDVSTWNPASAQKMNNMFYRNQSLKRLDAVGWDVSKAQTMASMFYDCRSLEEADLSGWNPTSVEDLSYMFYMDSWSGNAPSKLKRVIVDPWHLDNAQNMSGMFGYCTSLEEIDMSGWTSSPKLTNIGYMFRECKSIRELDMSKLDVSNTGSNNGNMFYECEALERLDIGGWEYQNSKYSFNSSLWTESHALRELTLGNMVGIASMYLQEHAATDVYTGKWVNRDNPYQKALTAQELMNAYDGSDGMRGTWVWEVRNTHYALSYHPQGGTMESMDQGGRLGEDIALLLPRRPGYKFTGWTTNPDGTGTSYGTTTYQGGLPGAKAGTTYDLYAQWERDTNAYYTVNYHMTGSEDGSYELAFSDSTGYEPIGTEVAASREFEGYRLNPDAQGSRLSGTVVDNISDWLVLDAYYDAFRYTIRFDANGGTGTMPDLPMTYGLAKNLPDNDFTNGSRHFAGWNTKPDGSGDSFINAQRKVNNLSTEDGAIVTLYAQWMDLVTADPTETAGEYTITLKGGQTARFVDLPAGTTYEIVEREQPAGWSLKSSDGTTGDIRPNTASHAFFENAYSATGSVSLQALKSFEGQMHKGDFTFQLEDADGNVMQTKTNEAVDNNERTVDSEGNVTSNPAYGKAPVYFDEIAYSAKDAGKTFTYRIREIPGSSADIAYDGHVETVTVVVEDRGDGTLACDTKYDEDGALFTNSFKRGTLQIHKDVVDATASISEKAFDFTVALSDSNDQPLSGQEFTYSISGTEETQTLATDESGVAVLKLADGQTATIDGLPVGTKYAVSEGMSAGFENTGRTGDTGTIQADGNSAASFENTYNAEGQVKLSATKVLVGKELAAGAYSFVLRDEMGQVLQVARNDANGTVEFDPIKYTLSSLGVSEDEGGLVRNSTRTFTYTISEELPDGVDEASPRADGVEYDTHVETVRVTVSEDGKGEMATAIETDDDGVVFTNTYTADGQLEPNVTKRFNDDVWPAGREFSFAISGDEGAPLPASMTVTTTAENPAASFGTIDYSLSDAGKIYTYTVSELVPEGAVENEGDTHVYQGVTYAAAKEMHVVVADNGDGTLNVTATSDDGDEKLSFTNGYDASGLVVLSAKKVLQGGELESGAYEFKLRDANGDVLQTKQNGFDLDGDGTVSGDDEIAAVRFDPIGYVLSDVEGGPRSYTIEEALPAGTDADAPVVDGVTYDTHVERVEVSLADKGDGTLSAVAAYSSGEDAATFTNVLNQDIPEEPTPTTTVDEPETPTTTVDDEDTPTTTVDDEETPKSGTAAGTTAIDDEDTPLSDVDTGDGGADAPLALLASALCALAVVGGLRRREKGGRRC